uniref:Major facilitator superfamily (MFS) profile domain-containing protein n=1 Tax=Aureoumbra lagunensis TaxID=44058 RepID=A0A7S3JZ30_9STRA|mmetsp:Transcript_14765/g.19619  ORF Transcript_14765/g.19619 Transcript_14765/m.19619 type:complete len:487 (-) Transcript_14765:174-1634(-)
MNRNVINTLCFSPCLTVVTSLCTAAPMAAFILLRTGSNFKVGLAVGAQGVANLCAAFPAATLADRFGRSTIIRFAVLIGFYGFGMLVYVVNTNRNFIGLAISLAVIGCFMGAHSSSVEAMFGDSIPSGQRSKLYARRASLRVAGNAVGPLTSCVVFFFFGDHWRMSELSYVMTAGSFLFIIPALFALSLTDSQTLGDESDYIAEVDSIRQDASSNEKTKIISSRIRRIAATIVTADLISMLGSGMTIKFIPLFLWRDCHLSPIAVNAVYACGPLGIACAAIIAQRASTKFGRIETTIITKFLGICFLIAMVYLRSPIFIIPVYLCRTWLMNCCSGLTRSVLNDYVPKSERARWNSFESINNLSWSGSAVLGGAIIERHGYRATFLVTAAFQLISAAILATAAPLVHREVSPLIRSAALLANDNDTTTTTPLPMHHIPSTSIDGYSLLEYDHPPDDDDRRSLNQKRDHDDAEQESAGNVVQQEAAKI